MTTRILHRIFSLKGLPVRCFLLFAGCFLFQEISSSSLSSCWRKPSSSDGEACLLLLLGMAATPGGLDELIILETPLKDVPAAANTAGMVAWACRDVDVAATHPVDFHKIFCPRGSGNLSRASFT